MRYKSLAWGPITDSDSLSPLFVILNCELISPRDGDVIPIPVDPYACILDGVLILP